MDIFTLFKLFYPNPSKRVLGKKLAARSFKGKSKNPIELFLEGIF